MSQLVTMVRPHICHRNAVEIGMSDCEHGCKIYRCTACGTTAVVHNPIYGCRKTK